LAGSCSPRCDCNDVERSVQRASAIHRACGEPGRFIVGGVLDVPGATMFEKMCYLRDHADGLRKHMLREPRGYPAANCNLRGRQSQARDVQLRSSLW
jgi:proline racemase